MTLTESSDGTSEKREVLTPELLPKEGEIISQSNPVSSILERIRSRIESFLDSIRPYKGNEFIMRQSDYDEVDEHEILGVSSHYGQIVAQIYADEDMPEEEDEKSHLKIFEE